LRSASSFAALTIPGVTPATAAALVLADEGCRDRLERSRRRADDLDPLRFGRVALARHHSDDRDAIDLEVCLDPEHLPDAAVSSKHRVGDQAARLKSSGGAPGPVAIVS